MPEDILGPSIGGVTPAEIAANLPAGLASATGASTGTQPTANGSGLFANQAKLRVDARDYGVVANGNTVSDASIASGSNQLSSSSAAFTSADSGKLCVVVGAGTAPSSTLSSTLSTGSGITSLPIAAAPAGGIPAGGVFVCAAMATTTSTLSTSAPITSIPATVGTNAIPAGTITLIYGVWRQTFTTSGAAGNASAIPVSSTTPAYPFPSGSSASIQQIYQVAGCPAGATSLPLMGAYVGHLSGSGGTNPALTTSGPITALTCVTVGPSAIAINTPLTVVNGSQSQTFTCSTYTTVGSTSILVNSQTPTFAAPVGSIIIGAANSVTPSYAFPSGSTVSAPIPSLSTTILSVAAGVATLNASAQNPVSNGECFYATDDAAHGNAALAATAVGGTCEFPSGQVGLSAALATTTPLRVLGQGVDELFGSLIGQGGTYPAQSYPNVAPYLRGTVLVQCSPATDVLQLNAQGSSQHVEKIGLRHAGRFTNTGHGLSSLGQPFSGSGLDAQDTGSMSATTRDVIAFGQDGNHYGVIWNNSMYARWDNLKAYGGGGIAYQAFTGQTTFGNLTFDHGYAVVFIAGVAHAHALMSFGTGGLDFTTLTNIEAWLQSSAHPVPWPGLVQPSSTGCQDMYHSYPVSSNSSGITTTTRTGFAMQADYVPSQSYGNGVVYPYGIGCAALGLINAQGPGYLPNQYPASGSSYKPTGGNGTFVLVSVILNPAATAVASSTLNGSVTYNAQSIVLTSATGFAAGQGIQIDTGALVEYNLVRSVAGNTVNLNHPLWNNHASGVAVTSGAAIAALTVGATSLAGAIYLGNYMDRSVIPIGGTIGEERTLKAVVPAGDQFRIDVANGVPQFANCALVAT